MRPLKLLAAMLCLSAVVGFGSFSLLASAAAASKADYHDGDKLAAGAASAPTAYKTTSWDSLMPKGWDPVASMKSLKLGTMQDGDPRTIAALDELKRSWNNAPVEPAMDGAKIRIAGFLIPLDAEGEKLHEFLLVPYFGACIHTPPPPANQVIHVTLAAPAKGFQMMEPIWVNGTMHVGSTDTAMGTSGYSMDGIGVARYTGR